MFQEDRIIMHDVVRHTGLARCKFQTRSYHNSVHSIGLKFQLHTTYEENFIVQHKEDIFQTKYTHLLDKFIINVGKGPVTMKVGKLLQKHLKLKRATVSIELTMLWLILAVIRCYQSRLKQPLPKQMQNTVTLGSVISQGTFVVCSQRCNRCQMSGCLQDYKTGLLLNRARNALNV